MDFKEILAYIWYGTITILVLSGVWILLTWGFDMVSMDNPPTLTETVQSFIDYWVEKFWAIPGTREFFQ